MDDKHAIEQSHRDENCTDGAEEWDPGAGYDCGNNDLMFYINMQSQFGSLNAVNHQNCVSVGVFFRFFFCGQDAYSIKTMV